MKSVVATGVVALFLLAPVSASSRGLPAHGADPLQGTWDSTPISLAKLRAALTANGYTTTSIDKMFHTLLVLYHVKKSIEYEVKFYGGPGGTPFQSVFFWDPTSQSKPGCVGCDHGPYKLLAGNRVTFAGTDPPTDKFVTTYGYSVVGKTLRLRFISLVEPGMSAAQTVADRKWKISLTVAGYSKLRP
jgi:hypothetical protein